VTSDEKKARSMELGAKGEKASGAAIWGRI